VKSPNSFILKTAAGILFFLVNIFALYLLLRGHNLPGGGFIAGLASAISIVLLGLALGFEEFETWMRFDPMRLASFGLVVALVSALLPLVPFFPGEAFFEHHMFHPEIPYIGKLHIGTTLLFDIGVLMVVVGITTKVVYVLARSTSGHGALLNGEETYYASPVERPVEEGHEIPEEEDYGS